MKRISAPQWAPWALPAALALTLTLIELGRRSLWLDEGASIAIASQHGAPLWHAIAHDGGNMLAYYLGLHVLIASLGDAISLLRLPSALFAAATAALVADMALRTLSRRAALYAGVLTAASLPMVFWGQDIRGYAAMIVLLTASFWALLRMLEAEPGWRGMPILFAACAALAVMCAIPAVLALPVQALAILMHPGRRRRRALVALGLAGFACLPVLVLAVRRGTGQLFWVGPPTWNEFGQTLRWLTSAGMPPNFHATWAAIPLLVVSLALLACLIPGAIFSTGGAPRWLGWTVIAWILVPLALDVAESLLGQPVLLTRNSLVSLPAVSLGLAWVLSHPRLPGAAGAVAVAVLLVLRSAVLAPSYGLSPEDWRGATGYVLAGAAAGDCLAFYAQDDQMPFAVYVRAWHAAARAPRAILPEVGWSRARPFVESYGTLHDARTLARCPRVWLIESHAGQPQGPPVSRAHLRRLEELRAMLERSFRARSSRTFGYAAAIEVTLFARARPILRQGRSPVPT